MRLSLHYHPDTPPEAPFGVEVEVARAGSRLALRYLVTGAVAELRLPRAAAPERANNLWQQTCFEAFVRAGTGGAYYEINLSPSTQWAAYRFSGYRSGMEAAELPAPSTESATREQGYELRTELDLAGWDLPPGRPWRLNLSAVIEEASGRKSYWALAHPTGKADFHHQNCFIHQLPGSPDK